MSRLADGINLIEGIPDPRPFCIVEFDVIPTPEAAEIAKEGIRAWLAVNHPNKGIKETSTSSDGKRWYVYYD